MSQLEGKRTVLDIGAHDGNTYSNSRHLIENGWSGVLVEPSPFAFSKLLQLYSDNANVTLINAAIGTENKLVPFFDCEGALYGSTDPSSVEKWNTALGIKFRRYHLPMMTIEMLQKSIDFAPTVVSIDTEGTSLDILKAMPIAAWCPHIIIVEHDERVVEIAGWAALQGYDSIVNAENLVLTRIGV